MSYVLSFPEENECGISVLVHQLGDGNTKCQQHKRQKGVDYVVGQFGRIGIEVDEHRHQIFQYEILQDVDAQRILSKSGDTLKMR